MSGQRLPALLVLAMAIAGVLVISPQAADACSVCMSFRNEDSKLAFRLTTAFLTFFPLIVLLGAGWWLRRRIRQIEGPPERDVLQAADAASPIDARA